MNKLAIFSANYLPNTGGVERYTYNLSKELASRGHRITIVTSNVFSLAEYENISENIEIYRLPCINLLNGRFPVLKFWSKDFESLHRQIKENIFDLTIVNTRFYLHSLYGAIIGRKYSKKVIAVEHGSAHLTVNSKIWDFLGRIFEHSITCILKFYVKDFYGVSKGCNEWLKHFRISAKDVLYNAVDIQSFELARKEENIDWSNYRLPETAKIISFTGRLVYEKGVLTLVEAFKLLKEKYNRNDIYLFMAGDGPLYENVNSQKTDNVMLLGKLTFNQIVSLLEKSTLFVFSSFSEGFPTSLLEAAVCNAYIITTPVSGVSELILNDTYGTIVSALPSPEEIAKSIVSIIDDDAKQKIACERCKKLVEENYTWTKTADKVESILNNVL